MKASTNPLCGGDSSIGRNAWRDWEKSSMSGLWARGLGKLGNLPSQLCAMESSTMVHNLPNTVSP